MPRYIVNFEVVPYCGVVEADNEVEAILRARNQVMAELDREIARGTVTIELEES